MSGPGRVLIVENDEDEIRVALRALERAALDVEVEVARNGVEALARLGLEEEDEEAVDERLPDVVLLDLKMPLLDGWAVLRRIRADARTTEMPVVVLTGSNRPEDVGRAYALGANSVLLKRLDAGGPGSYFAEAARYWTHFNRLPRALRRSHGRYE